MIIVTLVYQNGNRQEVLLSGVPRTGEGIRLRESQTPSTSLVVEYVMWEEGGSGGQEPRVLTAVRERKNEPPI